MLFCDGDHENFNKLKSYDISEWNGGKVQFVRKNIIHLMRCEVYEIDSKKIFVFGGGYSIDKDYRVLGKSWWPEEMPNEVEYENASRNLQASGYKIAVFDAIRDLETGEVVNMRIPSIV